MHIQASTLWTCKILLSSCRLKLIERTDRSESPCGDLTPPPQGCCKTWIVDVRVGVEFSTCFINQFYGKAGHVCCTKAKPKMTQAQFVFVRTCRKPRPGPGGLHLLPRVGQHVVTLGFVDQISTGLWRFDQLLVVHDVEQVGRVDEGKTNHRQELG